MKFIRKNGRIIPIKEKNDSGYKNQALIGITSGSVASAGSTALLLGKKIGNIKAQRFGARAIVASVVGSAIGEVMAIKKSYDTGKEKGFVSGLTRYAGLTATRLGGFLAGSYGFQKYAKFAVKRGVAKRAIKKTSSKPMKPIMGLLNKK